MHIRHKLGAAAVATAALTLSVAAGSASAAALPHFDNHHSFFDWGSRTVFVQTDNTAGNAVAVYDREPGGTLAAAGTYPTGGLGGVLDGSVVDHLASQNSLVYDSQSNLLFAVNAGSNTVSVFAVNGDHLALRQVISSGGTYPVSVAVHNGLVYVLNALNGGNVNGYYLVGGHLVPIPGSERFLNLNPASGATQFVMTPGDIAFTPNGSKLLVTTKANTNDIDVFGVNPFGELSATPNVNSEPGEVPFALAFEGNNQVDVGEAGTDAIGSFALGASGTLTPLSSVSTGEQATCWVVADGPWLFAGNAGSGVESSVLDTPSGALTLTGATPTDGGTVDAAVSQSGQYLYVQTGLNGIVDEFQVGPNGSLTKLGSVTVPNAVGGEGIATA
jgi:6-phosphogluconolactonase (cycloisomerase 2 family)